MQQKFTLFQLPRVAMSQMFVTEFDKTPKPPSSMTCLRETLTKWS